jgi:signal transduction histidine kinase
MKTAEKDHKDPSDRPPESVPAIDRPDAAGITAELIRIHVNRAHTIRARTVAGIGRRLGAWLASAFRRPRDPQVVEGTIENDPYTLVEHELKSPLTSIRSAAEILRHNQDLPIEERNRFLDALIQDNGRLEKVVDGLLHALEPHAGHGHRAAANEQQLIKPAA